MDIFAIIIGIYLMTVIYGWAVGASRGQEKTRVKQLFDERDKTFNKSFSEGRKWLAGFVADCRKAYDDSIENSLRTKKHPAHKAADIVQGVKNEKRQLVYQLKLLEYQLRSYEEYFPFLEEYKDVILDERVKLHADKDNLLVLNETDPVQLFLEPEEYKQLTSAQRNQLALDRYLARHKSNWEVGRMYERYLGYLYESDGWKVSYNGAIKGFEDFGRDLICIKNKDVEIIQAKCWSKEKVIREKHIFQLFGSTIHYKKEFSNLNISPVFICTTKLSVEAQEIAEALNVRVEYRALSIDYPMIKCNIGLESEEKIYHLPFDQQYDRVVIGNKSGEMYVRSVDEAEKMGFRRAWKYIAKGSK
jgi:hypothetical protein